MSDRTPTDEDVKLARKVVCWAGAGLEIFRHKLALAFAEVRAEEREACAKLVEDSPQSVELACDALDTAEKIRARGDR